MAAASAWNEGNVARDSRREQRCVQQRGGIVREAVVGSQASPLRSMVLCVSALRFDVVRL